MESPAIHILAGENVCIQVIRPTQMSSRWRPGTGFGSHPVPVSTGLKTIEREARRPVELLWRFAGSARRRT